MGTSDGISTEDWDVVHGLAVDIVNAPDCDKKHRTRQLLDYLEVLEEKYGRLPSIRGDTTNVVLAAQSLAELHLGKKNLAEADRWLSRMREHILARGDTDYSEYERLRSLYRGFAIKSDASIE